MMSKTVPRLGMAAGAAAVVAGLAVSTAGPVLSPTLLAQGDKIVRMQTLNVRDILYILTGGSNTLALMRDEGVLLVDTKPAGWGQAIRDNIESVTDQQVTTIINTHAHADHVGGNVDFPNATTIVAHANAKARMEKMPAFQGANAKFLPNKLVTDRLSLLEGDDVVEIYYFGRGHTDGDLVVVFPGPGKRVADFSDLFPGKMAPFIDVENGGSAVALPETLAKAVAEIKNIARVVTGHDEGSVVMGRAGPSAIFANPRTMTWADLQEYVDFNRDFLEAVKQAMAAGRSADEAAKTLQMPERYKAYDMANAPANVRAIYAELKK
jgi:glyoxylase-like metal-dependent hydrolase (beta-lactamase superfamily II)